MYSEGFESSHRLAQKVTLLYKLCSEQLTRQNHYDFGLRSLKSMLIVAGYLKRQSNELEERTIIIKALQSMNVPKFISNDAILFQVGNYVITACKN